MVPLRKNFGAGSTNASAEKTLRRVGLVVFVLLLLAASLAAAQDQDPAQQSTDTQPPAQVPSGPPMTVRGMVTNAATGDPLPRALVRIEGDADAGVLTNGDGHFEIPNVPVGPQTFRVLKPGFHDCPYATEEVEYQQEGPAHSVLVAPQMPGLNFSLTPNSAIRGFVELSTGDPAQNIPVVLVKKVVRYGRAVWAQDATARTNGDGSYRFSGLPDGTYAVYTQPALESEPAVTSVAAGSAASVARNGYPSVFYPSAREFSSAMRIGLAIGEQAQANLLLGLEPFQTVTATAFFPDGRLFAPKQSAEGGSDPAFVAAVLMDAAGRRLPYTAEFDSSTQTIQSALPDGIYTLEVRVTAKDANPQAGGGSRSNRKPAPYTGFAEFSVEGHAVTNLRIPLSPVPGWPVHIRVAQSALRPLQGSVPSGQGLQDMVTIYTSDASETPSSGSSENTTAEASGPNQLDLNGVGSGSLWINAQVNDRSLCVDSFIAGGTNLAREPLNLNPSATPPMMELTLRSDCATLILELPPALAAFLPGEEPFYTVYLVPDFDTTAETPPMSVHPSSGAMLTLDGLTPGSYQVYVFDTPVRLEYRNPAVLAALSARGQPVTLSPATSTHLVLEVPGR